VEAALRRRFPGGTAGISIAAAGSVVTLRGVVPALVLIDDLERAVRSIPGVRQVDALLLVGAVAGAAPDRRLATSPKGNRSGVQR
jgi:osmotically-inducible protein OsmY